MPKQLCLNFCSVYWSWVWIEPGKLDIFFSINIQEQSEKHSQTESNFISIMITSKFGWDLDKKSWKLKWKICIQASQDCFGKISIDIDSAAVQLEKCPISEMKTAVIKLKRLAMPNLKGWVKPIFLLSFLASSSACTLFENVSHKMFCKNVNLRPPN